MKTLPKGSEVIAHRGSPDHLLIRIGADEAGRDLGVIWRRGMGVSDPMLVAAIVKFGYWQRYEGSQGVLAEIEKEIADGGNSEDRPRAGGGGRDRRAGSARRGR